MDESPKAMRIYQGLSGSPAIGIFVARTDPKTHETKVRNEFLEGPTESSVVIAAQKRVAELEADPSVMRIIISVVSSERRREMAVVLPFNRVNGKQP